MNDSLHLLSQFHFLRPYWLLGVVPAMILFVLLWRRVAHAGEWQRSISPHLLQHLVQGNQTSDSKTPLKLLLAAWLIASVAMAGPTVQQLPAAMKKKTDARVIVLDLTLSMLCTDTPPSRLVRAKHKLSDILTRSKEGLTGLVVFAGSAHVVSPLTDDTNTILSMAGSLTPDIMPIAGSDPIAAIQKAAEVLKAGGAAQGQVLYIGDEMPDNFADALESLKGNIVLSVLAVGTAEGGPVAVGGGRYLKDNGGSMVLAPVNHERMREAAAYFGGRYSAMTADDSDINLLLANFLDLDSDVRETQREFDVWDDLGGWVALLILPLAALGYRKGWLGALLLPLLVSVTLAHSPDVNANESSTQSEANAQTEGPAVAEKAEATSSAATSDPDNSSKNSFWNGFWKNNDQQGKQAFDAKNYGEAAATFKSDDWKASALYNAGKYQQAEGLFDKQKTADGHYNRGNALAQQGKLDDAIKAYNEALKLNPDMADAKANRKTVKKLLKQQKQSQQGNSGKGGKDKDGKDANKNDSQQQKDQDKDQQNQQNDQNQQQGNDQKDNAPKDKDQQDKDQQNQSDQNASDKNSEQDKSSKKDSSSSDDKQKDDAANDQKQKDKKNAKQNQQPSADEKDQQQAENSDENQPPNAREVPTSPDDKKPETEDQQAMEQWLRRVPDDPGGLLRRKFYYESRLRRNNENQSNTQW